MEERRERTYNLLTQSQFLDQILKAKYTELEAVINELQTVRKISTEERDTILISKLYTNETRQHLIPMIESVQRSVGDGYDRRTRLASMLLSIVETIRVFPACALRPLKLVAEFRQNMIVAGDDIQRVDHYINNFVNAGLKRPRHHRFFSVMFKDQTMRSVRPDAEDLTKYYYAKKHSLSDAVEVESFQNELTSQMIEGMYPDLGSKYVDDVFSD